MTVSSQRRGQNTTVWRGFHKIEGTGGVSNTDMAPMHSGYSVSSLVLPTMLSKSRRKSL